MFSVLVGSPYHTVHMFCLHHKNREKYCNFLVTSGKILAVCFGCNPGGENALNVYSLFPFLKQVE